tara:strand:- start:52 stop:396 length:345 start_codon:yes stop_codon:yes gene_type:complete
VFDSKLHLIGNRIVAGQHDTRQHGAGPEEGRAVTGHVQADEGARRPGQSKVKSPHSIFFSYLSIVAISIHLGRANISKHRHFDIFKHFDLRFSPNLDSLESIDSIEQGRVAVVN